MPGLYGLVTTRKQIALPDISSMRSSLRYARAVVEESFQDSGISIGCVHVGTGGQRVLFKSDQATVMFFGYLTNPAFPPGTDGEDHSAAARHIHTHYIARGESVVSEISGAFALIIWDARTQTLLLATDRLGLRPIYYAEHAGIFRFASEIKALLTDPTIPHHLNKQALAEFTQLNFVMGEKTFFEDIHLLPPASILRFQYGHLTLTSYWQIPFPADYPKRPDRYYDDLIYETMRTAVQRMLRVGLRYGLSLSGGLDSRWIAALLAEFQPESLAFTLTTSGSDDTPSAQAVAQATGLKHYLWEVEPTLVADMGETYAYLVDGMDSLWHMEEFPLTVRVGSYADVSVGGFLGDGLFGYEINPVSAIIRKQDAARYRARRIQSSKPSSVLMTQAFKKGLGDELANLVTKALGAAYAESPGDRGFQAIQYYDLRQAERRYANIAQLAKLAFVDIYHPIADEDVVTAALQLPPNQLMFERAYRRALAVYLPKMAEIPWTFTLTPPTISIPGLILKKASQMTLGRYLRNFAIGQHPLIRSRRYYVDHTNWSRTALQEFIETSLLSPELETLGVFDMQGLHEIVEDHFNGRRYCTGFLGSLLALFMWARQFYIPSTPTLPDSLKVSKWIRNVGS